MGLLHSRNGYAVFHHPVDLRAGAGTRALGLIAAARQHGWQVDAASEDGVAERDRLADNGLAAAVAIHREADRLAAWWTRTRPDVVHVEVPGPPAMAWRIAAKRLGLPLTTTHHRLHVCLPDHVSVAQRTELIASNVEFMHACQRVMIEVPEERPEVATLGLHALSLVTNGVDLEMFTPRRRSAALRAVWKAADDTPVLLYVGRVLPAKGLDLLAATFAEVRRQHPASVMVVVGDGEGLAGLQQRCPWVIYTGLQRGAALAAAYASADIFLFPSRIESYGLVVVEAMASGLACVAFNRAAAGALIHDGVNGRLVADEAGFIAATLALLDEPASIQRCRTAALHTAAAQTWSAAGRALIAAWRLAIAAPMLPRARDPLTLVVRASLPLADANGATELPPGAQALLSRGHRLHWIDPCCEPCAVADGVELSANELTAGWSPELALSEARLHARAAGLEPVANPRRVSLVLTGVLVEDARTTRLASGLRRLGHLVELATLATLATAEHTWRETVPDIVRAPAISADAHALDHLRALAQRLAIRISDEPLPDGVDTDYYHPRHRHAELRQAWGVADSDMAVVVLVGVADPAAILAVHTAMECVRTLSHATAIAACITAAAAATLRAAGLTCRMVEGVSGSQLPSVLASADVVVLPEAQPTRGALLVALASGALLVIPGSAGHQPGPCWSVAPPCPATTDLAATLADVDGFSARRAAGLAYAETHSWTAIARELSRGW